MFWRKAIRQFSPHSKFIRYLQRDDNTLNGYWLAWINDT